MNIFNNIFRYLLNTPKISQIWIGIHVTILTINITVQGQSFDNGFNFYMPLYDSTNTIYLPSFNNEPIKGNDFVSTNSNGDFTYKGESIKFFGVNFTTTGAFPEKEMASPIAARLKKMGVNLVRFHHIDNGWSTASLFAGTPNTRQFNEINLDRMFYLITKLKEKGIFINMNLNVSRKFTEADGVINADSLDSYGKGVTQYDPHLIFLQKEYAYNLLSMNNPYTGISLANDPVMAMVEIINENSLFRMWRQGKLVSYSDGGKLIQRHAILLDSLWNNYLEAKYASTANLADAWNVDTIDPGPELLINGDFENSNIEENWVIELHEDAQATFSHTTESYSGDGAARVEVTNVTGTNWHIQFKQRDFSLSKDEAYEVEFYAKSPDATEIRAAMSRDIDPYTFYHGVNFDIDTEWKKYGFTFTCPEDNAGHGRFAINFQNQTSIFYIDNVSVRRAGISGLESGESLEDRNISRIQYLDAEKFSKQRKLDNMDFLHQVQSEFLGEMYQYLKDEVGVEVPVCGTNWFIGPEDLSVQFQLDYVDNHAYWEHPSFPNEPWSPTDWTIKNTPMVKSKTGGTISNLFSGYQFNSKPYTVSEYNHPFPNQYQSELLPLIISYAAFTGTDGIMLFDYDGTNDEDIVSGFFNTQPNPVIMANAPIFAYAYRNNLISEATSSNSIQYSHDDLLMLPYKAGSTWESSFPFDPKMALSNKITTSSFEADSTTTGAELPVAGISPYTSSTNELYWNDNGLFTVETPEFITICGQLDSLNIPSVGPIVYMEADKFATLSILSQDGNSIDKSRNGIISLTSRIMNTGMIWDGNNTIHDDWGESPTLIDPVKARIKLNLEADTLYIYPLSTTGQQTGKKIQVNPYEQQTFIIHLDQNTDQTLWFGYEILGNGTYIATGLSDQLKKDDIKIYPNPAKDFMLIEFTESLYKEIEIELLNINGSLMLNRRLNGVRSSIKIPCHGFRAGAYILRISSNKFNKSKLVIIGN